MKYVKTEDLPVITLAFGPHVTREEGMCAMEWVAYLNNEEHTDQPLCACRFLTWVVHTLNDHLGDRRQLLIPYLPQIIGTRNDGFASAREVYVEQHLCIRVIKPGQYESALAFIHFVEKLRLTSDSVIIKFLDGLFAIGKK